MLLYIAGPYSPTSQEKPEEQIAAHIAAARKIAIEVWEAGFTAICPHLNTANFEEDSHLPPERYYGGDLEILIRCDGLLLIPGWELSTGAVAEREFCEDHNIPIWEYPNLPNLADYSVEVTCPKQAQGFLSIVMQMYRLHLTKNRDYSPANILGTGEVGLVTRLWDKCARLMNLMGFRMAIASSHFEMPRAPKHESIDDTLIDLANYSVIGLLLRQKKWGK